MICADIVKGTTKVFGIIGDPVAHSFSPVIQNTIARELGCPMVYVPFPVKRGEASEAIKGGFKLGIEGFNVTVPHKTDVMDALTDMDSLAKKIGAVNTLKRMENGYKGYNTDILGLEKSLILKGVSLFGKTVVVLGAGGAARCAVLLAADRQASEIYIVNRTLDKARELMTHVNKFYNTSVKAISYQELLNIPNPEIVIQTTSLGMENTKSSTPVEEVSFFKKVEVVLEIIYTPWKTKLLLDAERAGCISINGFDMLLYQGMASYEIWNDVKIDKELSAKLSKSLTEYYKNL